MSPRLRHPRFTPPRRLLMCLHPPKSTCLSAHRQLPPLPTFTPLRRSVTSHRPLKFMSAQPTTPDKPLALPTLRPPLVPARRFTTMVTSVLLSLTVYLRMTDLSLPLQCMAVPLRSQYTVVPLRSPSTAMRPRAHPALPQVPRVPPQLQCTQCTPTRYLSITTTHRTPSAPLSRTITHTSRASPQCRLSTHPRHPRPRTMTTTSLLSRRPRSPQHTQPPTSTYARLDTPPRLPHSR